MSQQRESNSSTIGPRREMKKGVRLERTPFFICEFRRTVAAALYL